MVRLGVLTVLGAAHKELEQYSNATIYLQQALERDSSVSDLGNRGECILKHHEIIVVGAGAAGIGIGAALRRTGLHPLILDRYGIGGSFFRRPKQTTLLTPSFASNAFGLADLNAVSPESSPAPVLQTGRGRSDAWDSVCQRRHSRTLAPPRSGAPPATTCGKRARLQARPLSLSKRILIVNRTRLFSKSRHAEAVSATQRTATVDLVIAFTGASIWTTHL